MRNPRRISFLTAAAAALALAGAPLAHAVEWTTWTVEEANLTLSLPSELSVVTRAGVQSHSEALVELGLTEDALHQMMLDLDAYVDAFRSSAAFEYRVKVTDPPEGVPRVWNATAVPDALGATVTDAVIQHMQSLGFRTEDEGRYRHADTEWFVYAGSADDGSEDYLQYYTIVNGRMTSVTLHSYQGPITDAMREELASVVDSVRFLTVLPDPHPELAPAADSGFDWGQLLRRVVIGAAVAALCGCVVALRKRKTLPFDGS